MKNRLLSSRELQHYLRANYNLKTNIEKYIEKNDHIKLYNVPYLSNYLPTKLYQDLNLDQSSPSAFDIALSLKKIHSSPVII